MHGPFQCPDRIPPASLFRDIACPVIEIYCHTVAVLSCLLPHACAPAGSVISIQCLLTQGIGLLCQVPLKVVAQFFFYCPVCPFHTGQAVKCIISEGYRRACAFRRLLVYQAAFRIVLPPADASVRV